ncbi:dTMP kinase [Arthrobacter sp. MMS24-T111]
MIIVLTGIDGSGKSTAARALVAGVRARGGRARLLNNHAGRRVMSLLAARLGVGLPRGRFLPWLLARLPEPDAIFHLDIEPADAYRRIVSRGTDSETLDDLASFQSGYRELPEYAGFVKLDASVPAHELAADIISRLTLPAVTKPD